MENPYTWQLLCKIYFHVNNSIDIEDYFNSVFNHVWRIPTITPPSLITRLLFILLSGNAFVGVYPLAQNIHNYVLDYTFSKRRWYYESLPVWSPQILYQGTLRTAEVWTAVSHWENWCIEWAQYVFLKTQCLNSTWKYTIGHLTILYHLHKSCKLWSMKTDRNAT